ncbi:hypothetical protein AN401_04130 [Zobellella denitrificans]|uniref:DUF2956 domain-containing protein n=1 Tax=Zobellella denitrificans TaxID=347534 RepID=A0A291HM24_9GAMM|nr:DUF2956 family protein [Zobellella denitrificans]ATG73141.1 hypothetical protein AN401_04130 [Zobellella denitrificans]
MRYQKNRPAEASPQTQSEAERIARATQRPGQTKEQTRLIAQGIQKGIEEYKKQQKAKARAADKARKQQARRQDEDAADEALPLDEAPAPSSSALLPWLLLALSWLGFGLYLWLMRG